MKYVRPHTIPSSISENSFLFKDLRIHGIQNGIVFKRFMIIKSTDLDFLLRLFVHGGGSLRNSFSLDSDPRGEILVHYILTIYSYR